MSVLRSRHHMSFSLAQREIKFRFGALSKSCIGRYFDNSEKRCMPFYYGGCEGNLNRFDSQENCQRSCPSEFLQNDVCQMKQEPGPCRDFLQRLVDTGYALRKAPIASYVKQ